MPEPIPMRQVNSGPVTSIAASWATTAFQHVSLDESSPEPGSSAGARSLMSASSRSPVVSLPGKTVDDAKLPALDEASRLPPGGAWELVEPSEVQNAPVPEEARAGADALREDIDDVLHGASTVPFRRYISSRCRSVPAPIYNVPGLCALHPDVQRAFLPLPVTFTVHFP